MAAPPPLPPPEADIPRPIQVGRTWLESSSWDFFVAIRKGCGADRARDFLAAPGSSGAPAPVLQLPGGETFLHLAARFNNVAVIPVLVEEAGTDVNARDRHGQTPLHMAARHNSVDAARALLRLGALVDAKATRNVTPLHLVFRKKMRDSLEVADLLLFAGADIDAMAITVASIMASASPDFVCEDTVLSHAVWWGKLDLVRFLLDRGADVNKRSRTMGYLGPAALETCLIRLSNPGRLLDAERMAERLEIVRILVLAGANLYETYSLRGDGRTRFRPLVDGHLSRSIRDPVNLDERVVDLLKAEPARRLNVLRLAGLQRQCWLAAIREELDVDRFLPPVVRKQNRRWVAEHPWIENGELERYRESEGL